jgi:large conductance mechanosensitive channel
MQGFKEFVLKGNLVELAVAFIMGTAFAAVVTEFSGVLLSFIGKVGGEPDFSEVSLVGVNVGLFLNALLAFVIIALVLYFFVVTPYNKALEHFKSKDEDEVVKTDDLLVLEEIRDLLASRTKV